MAQVPNPQFPKALDFLAQIGIMLVPPVGAYHLYNPYLFWGKRRKTPTYDLAKNIEDRLSKCEIVLLSGTNPNNRVTTSETTQRLDDLEIRVLRLEEKCKPSLWGFPLTIDKFDSVGVHVYKMLRELAFINERKSILTGASVSNS